MSNRWERGADKKQNEKFQLILRELLREGGNRVCVDCKGKDPRWASANLGVFMCIRCSGVHRSMGTHISKVRSVDLDSWTPEHIEVMQMWGNARANRYWEARLPASHSVSDQNVDTYIRSKYQHKKWVLSPQLPHPSTLDAGSPAASAGQPSAQSSGASTQRRQEPVDLLGTSLIGDFGPSKPQQQQQKQTSLLDNDDDDDFGDFSGFQAAPAAPPARPTERLQHSLSPGPADGVFFTQQPPAIPAPVPAAAPPKNADPFGDLLGFGATSNKNSLI